jgi:hypothetical protein
MRSVFADALYGWPLRIVVISGTRQRWQQPARLVRPAS